MDFSLNDEQQMLHDTVRRYLAADYGFERRAAILQSSPGWSREVWQQLAEPGLLALDINEADGGIGAGLVGVMVVAQAAGQALLQEPWLDSAVYATRTISALATPDQRQEWLPRLAAGELVAVLAHEEDEASFDVDALTTRAERDGQGWCLRGSKRAIVHAPIADLLLVSARIGADEVAVFAVAPDHPGLHWSRYRSVAGVPCADLHFDGVRVPDQARLGAAGDHSMALQAVLDYGLAALCADALGTLERCLDGTVAYVRERRQFGVPIGRFQALQHRLADLLIEVEQARSMVLLACSSCLDSDAQSRRRALSAAKVVIAEAARKVGQQAVQLHGGMGMTDELDISHCFKRLLAFELRAGDRDRHLDAYAMDVRMA